MNHKGILWSCDRLKRISLSPIDFLLHLKCSHTRKSQSAETMERIISIPLRKTKIPFGSKVIYSTNEAKHSLVLTFRSKILIKYLIPISPIPSKLQLNPSLSKAPRAQGNILGVYTVHSARTKLIIREMKLQISHRSCQHCTNFDHICCVGPKLIRIRVFEAIYKNNAIL